MNPRKDGGPAFPLMNRDYQEAYGGAPGMSLRDWFAGQALMGFMANTSRPTTYTGDDAEWAYTIADAMLAARASLREPRETGEE